MNPLMKRIFRGFDFGRIRSKRFDGLRAQMLLHFEYLRRFFRSIKI